MRSVYYAKLESADGIILVTFPDVPEAITQGDDEADAIASASDALTVALLGYAKLSKALPAPRHGPGDGLRPILIPVNNTLKLAVIAAFNAIGITKVELAARLGKAEGEARRILDPDHATKVPALEAALAAMGKQAIVEVRDAY